MAGETEPRANGDKPLGRVVLVPLDGIAVVHRELVVEIVVALADRAQRGDHMVARGVLVVERSIAQPVREGVDAEGRLHPRCQHA